MFRAARVDDEATLDVIRATYAATRHRRSTRTRPSAVGAAERLGAPGPIVTLATAHPAKFPDAVERATGVRPPLPAHLADLFDRPERVHRAAQRPRGRSSASSNGSEARPSHDMPRPSMPLRACRRHAWCGHLGWYSSLGSISSNFRCNRHHPMWRPRCGVTESQAVGPPISDGQLRPGPI